MQDIKPRGITGLKLVTSIFNVANMAGQTGRNNKTMAECVKDTLENLRIAVDLPVQINTADEYAQLFESAFNAAALELVAHNKIPSPLATQHGALKLIEYLKGQNVIKLAPTLKQEIY